MKNTYSRTNSTQIDALKENKALYEMPWDIIPSGSSNVTIIPHTTTTVTTTSRPISSTTMIATTSKNHTKLLKKNQMKSQTLFGKKESSSLNKKIKVLCEASTSSSKIQNIVKGTTGGEQLIQVPRKRIKVSASSTQQHQLPIKSASDHETSNYDDNFLKVYGKLSTNLQTSTSMTNFFHTTNSDTNFEDGSGRKSKSDGKLKTFSHSIETGNDLPNLPCCSLSLKRNPKVSLKTHNPSTSVTANTNLTRTNKNKLRKCSSLPNLSKKANSDGTKLKKKRILKTEAGLKRKKSRVKTVWH